MGVQHLWSTLERVGALHSLSGGDQHAAIAEEVDGLCVSVDTSTWLLQALSQPGLTENIATKDGVCLKLVFERVRAAPPEQSGPAVLAHASS